MAKKSKIKVEKKAKTRIDINALMAEMGTHGKDMKNFIEKTKTIKSSYSINFRHKGLQKITGGLQAGQFVEVSGGSQSGKSFLMYEAAQVAIENGGYALLKDLERALEEAYINMVGIDRNFLGLSYENKIELMFPIIIKFVNTVRKTNPTCPIFVGIDSFPACKLQNEQEVAEEAKDNEKKEGYIVMRRNAAFYAKLETFLQVIADQQVVFMLLNQTRKDRSNPMFPKTISRGEDIFAFWAHKRIRGKLIDPIKKNIETAEGKYVKKIGAQTAWTVIKNRGVMPWQSTVTKILYSKGINEWSGLTTTLVQDESLILVKPKKQKDEKAKAAGSKKSLDKKPSKKETKDYRYKLANPLEGEDGNRLFMDGREAVEAYPRLLEPLWTGTATDEFEQYDTFVETPENDDADGTDGE